MTGSKMLFSEKFNRSIQFLLAFLICMDYIWMLKSVQSEQEFFSDSATSVAWGVESGIGPWVCIYGQIDPTIIGHYVEISRHSGAMPIVRRFFWRSVSTRGLFNIELRLRHVLWSVGLSSYSRGLRGCWGHLLSPSGVLAACNRRCRRRRRNAACRHLQSVQRPPRGRADGLSTENSTAGGRFGLPWFHEFFVRLALFFIQRQVFNCWGRGIKLPII